MQANTLTYHVAEDGTLRNSSAGSIAQQPRLYYGCEYSVALSFPANTLAEGDQLQVALNKSRTFFSSASATGDAPVAAVVKHAVTAEEAAAQAVSLTLSTNTRAMIDQVNGIDHPVRGFLGVHVLRGQSFVTLCVADALMLSLESGPDAISPSLPVTDYPTREEAEQLTERAENAAERAEEAAGSIDPSNFIPQTEKASPNGVATLDSNGKLTASQLPVLHGNSAPTTSTAGVIGQTYSDDSAGKTYTCVSIGGTEQEPQYNWKEGVYLGGDGKISPDLLSIPIANSDHVGGVKWINSTVTGLYIQPTGSNAGLLSINSASNTQIDSKNNYYNPIVPSNLDYAVRSVSPNITTISPTADTFNLLDASATTNNHSHVYRHVPTTAPTYFLPSISNSDITHDITVEVDFSNVASCSFKDAGGSPVFLQKAIKPTLGDLYVFRCEWHSRWFVMPIKVRSFAKADAVDGLIQVTDAVAGSPRSLTMYGDAWVRNQYAPAVSSWGYSSSGGLNDISTNTTSNNVFTSSGTNQEAVSARYWLFIADFSHKVPFVNGHVYFVGANMSKQGIGGDLRLNVMQTESSPVVTLIDYASSFSPTKVTFSGDTGNYAINVFSSSAITLDVGWSLQMSMQIVDLTQLCNGDSTKIAAIQTWDDLVAAYPEYAQYVAYNTGTVVGLTPTLQVNNGDGGTMTASAPLFGVGSARDEEEGIGGTRTSVIRSYTFTGQESWSSASSSDVVVFQFALSDMKIDSRNGMLAGYIPTTSSWQSMPDKSVKFFSNNNKQWMYVRDENYTSASDFKASMSGKTVYYELATPVQSSVQPSQITLQDGENVVMQTDGGRVAAFGMVYENNPALSE